jgi:hypothetical protein
MVSILLMTPLESFLYFNGVSDVDPAAKCTLAPGHTMCMLAIGDSLVFGTSTTPHWRGTGGKTYVDLYAQSDTSGLLKYANMGHGGWKLQNLIDELPTYLAYVAANPGYANYACHIGVGVNDGNFPGSVGVPYPSGTSGTDWQTKAIQLVNALRAGGFTRVTWATITPQSFETRASREAPNGRQAANDFLESLVPTTLNAVVPFGKDRILGNVGSFNPATGVLGPGSQDFDDYVHPSLRAHWWGFLVAAPIFNAQAVNTTGSPTPPPAPPPPPAQSGQQWSAVEAAVTGANGLPNGVLLGSNRIIAPSGGNNVTRIRATIPLTGKSVIEIRLPVIQASGDGSYAAFGVLRTSAAATSNCNGAIDGFWLVNCLNQALDDGTMFAKQKPNNPFPRPFAANARVLFAVDEAARKGWYSLDAGVTWNGNYGGAGDPVSGANPAFTWAAGVGSLHFFCSLYLGTASSPTIDLPDTIAGTIPNGYTGRNT